MKAAIKTIAIVALILCLVAFDFYGVWQANRAYGIMWDEADLNQQIAGAAFIFIGGHFILAVILASVYALTVFIYSVMKARDK